MKKNQGKKIRQPHTFAVRAHGPHNPLELREPQSVCLVLQLCGGLIEINAGAGPASCTGLTLNSYVGGFSGYQVRPAVKLTAEGPVAVGKGWDGRSFTAHPLSASLAAMISMIV